MEGQGRDNLGRSLIYGSTSSTSVSPSFDPSVATVQARLARTSRSLGIECPQCAGQRPHGRARWRAAPGDKRSVASRSQILCRRAPEGQVSGDKPGSLVGPTRPMPAVAPGPLMPSTTGVMPSRQGSAAGGGAATRMLGRFLRCRREGDIGPRRLELDGAQGLDEQLRGWRQGPATKIEHAVSRPHFRHTAVQLDEAPRRNVLGQQRGGAREQGVAVTCDQPGVCQRIDQDLRNETCDARAATKSSQPPRWRQAALVRREAKSSPTGTRAPAPASVETPWSAGAQAGMRDRPRSGGRDSATSRASPSSPTVEATPTSMCPANTSSRTCSGSATMNLICSRGWALTTRAIALATEISPANGPAPIASVPASSPARS